jgi:hypothetical protein
VQQRQRNVWLSVAARWECLNKSCSSCNANSKEKPLHKDGWYLRRSGGGSGADVLRLLTAVNGTEQTSRPGLRMSLHGENWKRSAHRQTDAFDPKRKSDPDRTEQSVSPVAMSGFPSSANYLPTGGDQEHINDVQMDRLRIAGWNPCVRLNYLGIIA